jgi:flavodoxin
MSEDFPNDGIKLGDEVDGQILVAVGIDFTFTEIIESHQKLLKSLDEWLTGIRTYGLEDKLDTDAQLWDELEDCGYDMRRR